MTAPGGRIWVAAKDLYAPQLQALTDALGGESRRLGVFPAGQGQTFQLTELLRAAREETDEL